MKINYRDKLAKTGRIFIQEHSQRKRKQHLPTLWLTKIAQFFMCFSAANLN